MCEKKMLVTGGSGFVGSRMKIPGAMGDWQVLCPSHSAMDITDEKSVMAWFEENRPQAVVHSAAISDIGECEENPEKSYLVNVQGTLNIARACKAYGAKMLFMSTDQVYSGCTGTEPVPEDAPLEPINLYAKHKLEAEAGMLAICPDACALRLTWMFDMPVRHQVSKGLVTNCIRALMNGDKMRLCANDRRAMTYVREVVENIPVMLQAPGGIYNYGSQTFGSTYDTFMETFDALGCGHRKEELLSSFVADTPRNLLMDTAKATRVGCKFSETVDGVRRLLKEYPL